MTALTAIGIAVAGGLGAASRFALDSWIKALTGGKFPWGIAIVNLTGSFALGILAGLALAEPAAAILATGFLGGYTTFSTASVDSVRLLQERRYGAALANGPGLIAAAAAVALLGILLGRGIAAA